MTDTKTEEVKPESELQRLMRTVSDNPAQIVWPRDEWGFTSALRKEIALVAGKIGGNKAKQDLIVATLMVGLAHIRKRTDKDARVFASRRALIIKSAEQRIPLERFLTYKKEDA